MASFEGDFFGAYLGDTTGTIVEPPGYKRQTFFGAQPSNANGQAEGKGSGPSAVALCGL